MKMMMDSVVIVLLRSTFLIVFLVCACTATDSTDDVLGLIVFKSDITDTSAVLSSWNEEDASPCSWRFIQCDPATSRVSGIFLDALNLSGNIGFGLEKLQHLKTLSLSNNNFTITSSGGGRSRLPSSLHSLNLSNNRLSGRIPSSLINITSINSLDLSQNSFSGPIPDDFFSGCFSLRFLSLARNSLEGPIPTTLSSSCSLLTTLNLSSNHFSGNPNFATLHHLQALDLSGNLFSGSLPSAISSLLHLNTLVLKSNQFSGPIPTDIGFCPHLSILDLSNNLFTETLPESLRRLNSLTFLSLSNNLLSGDFPQWIGNMSSLEIVDLSRNRLSGTVSGTLGSLQSLKFLSLSENGLSGGIPASLGDCSKLSVIRLSRNSLSGDIPTSLFNLGLQQVDFSHNGLTGFIPSGSTNLFRSLQVLDLSRNNLTGIIPAEMGLFSNLQYLNLSWNNLHSKIPPEIGYFQNLTVVDLRSNAMYGSVPGDICDSGTLSILQLDSNSLTGPIPEEIGNCSSLYLLSLSHNNLSGPVPESMSMLNKLKILKLEWNELSGEIPQSLGKLENLLAVNISFNKFTGRLPKSGIFPSLDPSALQGNPGICSPLLTGPCQMNNVPKPLVLDPNSIPNTGHGSRERRRGSNSDHSSSQHMFFSVSAILAISATGLIACGVLVVVVLNAAARRRLAFVDANSMTLSSSGSEALASGKLILLDNKLNESLSFMSNPQYLLNKASAIGEGVFGTVYKVLLGEQGSGDEVAIKRLDTSSLTQYQEDFDREVRVLGKARHPNLVSLKGYYWSPELQLLVTEYAPNGSLQTKLHDRIPSSAPLSWAVRSRIVVDVAKGLAHLHHCFRPPIIHYNIKPGNILLDRSYNAKISDYGLVRLLSKLDQHVLNNRFESARGYVAPELACQSMRVNEKCDVYSFGILILEVVTGRRPVEYGEDNVMILKDHVRNLVEQGNVLECVDPTMGEYREEEVVPVIKLALVCTTQIPSSRPSMDEVVQILQVINSPSP